MRLGFIGLGLMGVAATVHATMAPACAGDAVNAHS